MNLIKGRRLTLFKRVSSGMDQAIVGWERKYFVKEMKKNNDEETNSLAF